MKPQMEIDHEALCKARLMQQNAAILCYGSDSGFS
jgi:hypothetical protein